MDQQLFEHTLLKLHERFSVAEQFELKERLAGYISFLLLNDFNKLVEILYRVDVNEEKLKQLLRDNPETDASILITDLLIQRHQQKIKTRETFKKDENIDEEEKW
ncbi:MAG: hypothetical protein ACJ749_07465 [Flavisolibacter sp.]